MRRLTGTRWPPQWDAHATAGISRRSRWTSASARATLRRPRQDSLSRRGPGPDEQLAAMGAALARVQAKHSAWTRGQLCGELADVLPPSIASLAPAGRHGAGAGDG